MRFVLAPDSFKESMTAYQAAIAMEKGVRQVFPDAECVLIPMADGGEGTVEALVTNLNGQLIKTEVVGPLGDKVQAEYGISKDGKTAILEMASASGIHLVRKEERNPLITTTFGTGELIQHALSRGVTQILMGIGGSVTNDGGVGMLQALGVSFRDQEGRELPYGGGALGRLHTIDVSKLDPRLQKVKIEVACDVTNPLIGPNGASIIFGPQKGATPDMVLELESNLTHYANVIKQELGTGIANASGAGAAGGLGAGLMAFLQATLKPGVELVIHYTDLEKKMIGADFVFTGEGSIDGQTLYGKTPYGVAATARKQNIPVIALAGRVGEGAEQLYDYGFTALVGILREATSLEKALVSGSENLTYSVQNVCRILKLTLQEKRMGLPTG